MWTDGEAPAVLVGGIGQLYQGDLDLGRRAVDELRSRSMPPWVAVEELHYGAVAVGQLLADLRPRTLVLIGAEPRGRPPGTVTRGHARPRPDPAAVAGAVSDAVTGHVGIDLVVDVAAWMQALPPRTVVVEVEPASTDPSEELSAAGQRALAEVVDLVVREVRHAPLHDLARSLRDRALEARLAPSAALDALRDLLDELGRADATGTWGRTFAERDRLRLQIAEGQTGEGMDQLDWGLWWNLIEELDRVERADV